MEGPYRDLGSGFARLTGVEGVRRSPSRIQTVEDALFELLRNAREAGARNIYVASSLRGRRYRTLTVIDDGHGIPESYKDLVFEPGVTTRHLTPNLSPGEATAAGLSLHHIRNASVSAAFFSISYLTSIKATFDTHTLPERSLQSATRSSRSNLLATVQRFRESSQSSPQKAEIYYASPARIAATLIENRIIQLEQKRFGEAERLGLEVSGRTLQRVLRGEVRAVGAVGSAVAGGIRARGEGERSGEAFEGYGRVQSGARLDLGEEEMLEIAAILGKAARRRYLEVGDIELESRPGEIVVRSRIYEPEDEYEG